jgi:hypothetical protein
MEVCKIMAQGREGNNTSNNVAPAYNMNTIQITNALANYIAMNKKQIDVNAANLIQAGKDMTKLGVDATGFGIKNADQDRLLTQYRGEFDAAKIQRDSNAAKLEQIFAEQQNIYDSISQKADASHSHECTDCNGTCEWFDIPCQLAKGYEEGIAGIGKLAIIGVIGFIGFMLIKKRLGI